MNPLREWRRLRAVPDEPEPEKHEAVHSNGMPGPSLALVTPWRGTWPPAMHIPNPDLPADALDDAPPVPAQRVSARPGDPTPIFDSVMTDKWWPVYTANGIPAGQKHALATQFEVAFILGEFSDEDRAEIAREASEDVDWGWGPVS